MPTWSIRSPARPMQFRCSRWRVPQAVTNERLGVLFDSETLKPRITDAAFVDALTRLAASKTDANTAHAANSSASAANSPQIPVLGYGDRLAAVTASSHNAADAFILLEWLARPETSVQFARIGTPQLPPWRALSTAAAWYDPSLSASERAEHSKLLETELNGERSLIVPHPRHRRLPSRARRRRQIRCQRQSLARRGPEEGRRRWEEITNTRGRDKQRDAYQKHLGISQM